MGASPTTSYSNISPGPIFGGQVSCSPKNQFPMFLPILNAMREQRSGSGEMDVTEKAS